MSKKTMETETGTIVNFSFKKGKLGNNDWAWFVRNKAIKNGEPQPVNRGGLEWYLTEKVRKAVMKQQKNKEK